MGFLWISTSLRGRKKKGLATHAQLLLNLPSEGRERKRSRIIPLDIPAHRDIMSGKGNFPSHKETKVPEGQMICPRSQWFVRGPRERVLVLVSLTPNPSPFPQHSYYHTWLCYCNADDAGSPFPCWLTYPFLRLSWGVRVWILSLSLTPQQGCSS